ncbi:hypothetical protein ILUMI_13709 [Ignelater luminosus]|uniref:Mutator-like transposase domain-containing protein n=1 Tax=Ignelater luminosus TaxID=2038154 RepID=A0A8K0CRX4_IGNLU|nr:hypothetical protein ILUMI_13709 [Ignelater luminosus]
MGNYTKQEKNFDKRVRKLSTKRKSRRNIALRQHAQRKSQSNTADMPCNSKSEVSKIENATNMLPIQEPENIDGIDAETDDNGSENLSELEVVTDTINEEPWFAPTGYSQIEEIAASIDMPMMSDTTYQKFHELVSVTIRETAWKIMEEAGRMEAELAKELGEVDRDNVPCITVVTDGAWSKRSYNVNYNTASGVCDVTGPD